MVGPTLFDTRLPMNNLVATFKMKPSRQYKIIEKSSYERSAVRTHPKQQPQTVLSAVSICLSQSRLSPPYLAHRSPPNTKAANGGQPSASSIPPVSVCLLFLRLGSSARACSTFLPRGLLAPASAVRIIGSLHAGSVSVHCHESVKYRFSFWVGILCVSLLSCPEKLLDCSRRKLWFLYECVGMDIVESVRKIPLQDPPEEDFCAADLTWTKFGNAEHHDEVALIPYDRVDDFIIGECSNVEWPTRFHIERGRKRAIGSLKEYKDDEYLEYRLYWCSFGPENYGEGGGILPSRRYRLNTRNRAARPQSMRGCTCHFVVKRLYARPYLALIIYNERRHINKSGFVCHGPLDRDAIGPGAKNVPYICNEIQQQTMSMIYLGIPEENILEKHIEGIQRYCGSDAKVNSLASQYVHKLGMIIKRSTHELDLDDQASIRMWVERNKKSVFFYQDTSESDPFVLGIQTEWQLQQMIRFGHCSVVVADSTFGIKRLKYPLFTLLVFDSRQHALPVAWVITRSFSKPDMSKWLNALIDRAHSVEPGWRVSGFVIDDAAAEIDLLRQELLL
ncbi:hypothetical protein Ahy_A08g040480 isoform C [Arachis hypogaea]|uniref:MULE transposase domain-containing protein n=1 Tax=Arachis hypogaea TaxID=3818 RepID=A0A445BZB9_ARAHY|nr:hypothetical protein Ahy_A08g040480 isoform C [Arachis hypogaea]